MTNEFNLLKTALDNLTVEALQARLNTIQVLPDELSRADVIRVAEANGFIRHGSKPLAGGNW